MGDFVSLVVLALAALPVALLFLPRAQAIFATAIVSGVSATVAGVLHVATNVPIAVMWLVLLTACAVTIAAVPTLRAALIANYREPIPFREYLQLAIVGVVIVIVISFPPAPLAWDARSIWFFHASWLSADASAFIDGQTLKAVAFSHPNYPILGPASMAVSWGLAGGGENLVLAQQVSALLSILVAALGGSILVRRFAGNVNAVVATVGFALFVTAALTVGDGLLNQGYMDALQASFIVALLALLVVAIGERMTPVRAGLITLVAIGATAVKQEGFWFSVVVIAVFLVITVRQQYLLKYAPLAGVLAFYGAWKLFLAAIGASDTTDASGVAGRLPELLDPSSTAWSIIMRIATREFTYTIAPLLLILVFSLAGAVLVTRRRTQVVRAALLIVLSVLGITGITVLTYALGNTRDVIDWWLSSSFSRIFATVEYITWFAVFLGVLVISPWTDPTRLEDPANASSQPARVA
jgi:hypothetical protein